jgi:chromosomal replication initiator protein DnaA
LVESVDKLVKATHQTSPVKREKAIKTLCDFCMANPNQSQQAIPDLSKLLRDGEIKISSYTAQTMVRIGKANKGLLTGSVNPLLDFVNHALSQGRNYSGSWTTVSEVVETLGEIGAYAPSSGRPAIGTLFKVLNPPLYHPQNFIPGMEKVFAGAAHAIGLFANQSSGYVKDIVPSIFKSMVDTYTYPRLVDDARNRNGFRWWIIYALLELGKANPSYVIPSLVKALTHPNLEVRKKVIEILDSVASDPRTAVPPLVQCINSLDSELSKNAALTLGSLGQSTPEFVIPSLISLLQSKDMNVLKNSMTVVQSLAKSAPGSVMEVKEYLIPALNNQDNEIRHLAVRIFYLVGQANTQYVQETIPYLIYINMNDPSQAVKDESVGLLNLMGVDVNKYTLTIEVLRQTQELVSKLNNEKKDSSKVTSELQKSKDALIELNYEVGLGSANKAYEMATKMLSGEAEKPPTKVIQTAPPKEIAKKVEERTEQETLLKEYDFNSFVKGPNNSFALAAAKAVSENPSQAYNPLFVYSGAGLGKTHLLNAIGNQYKTQSPLASVIYITSEKFTNELINSIQNNSLDEFRNRYRNVDILLIDDIQSIAGKERTQEEFFNTFNALFNNKKQIVISSDKPPSEIPTLEERLKSRFEWGLITEIGKPDFETRVAILQNKSTKKGVSVDKDVLDIIANHESGNIRNLEGALNEVLGFAKLNKKELSPDVAKEALKIEEVEQVSLDDLELDWGTTYVSKEATSDQSFKFYNALIKEGLKGLCVSRVHPDKLKKRYKMKDDNLFWLSKTPSAESMSPTDISKMAHVFNTFIKDNNNSVLLLDGLEYLISNNDFKLVMRFLDDINEHVVVGHSVFILPITESTYSSKELTLLERNTVHLQDDMITYANVLIQELETDAAGGPSKEELLDTQKKQEEILELITNAQERINTAKSLGLKITAYEDGLKDIRELSNSKDYDTAINKANSMMKKLNGEIEGSLDRVSDIIEKAKSTLKEAEDLMVKTEEMDSLLNQAIGAFRLNMYEEALEYANKMIEKAEEPINYRKTVNLLKEAKEKITEARDNDLDPSKSEEFLRDAKPAILAKNYRDAQILAMKSINSAKKLLGEEVEEIPEAEGEEATTATGIDAGSFSDIMDRINIAKMKLSKSIGEEDEAPTADGEAPTVETGKAEPSKPPKEDKKPTEPPKETEKRPKPSKPKKGKNPRCPDCETLLLVGSKFCNKCGITI